MRGNQGRRYSNKRKDKLLIFLCVVSVIILICVCVILVLLIQSRDSESLAMEPFRNRESINGSGIAMAYTNDLSRVDLENADTSYEDCGEWRLILVNADNPIPDDFYPNLIALDNGQRVDERILEPLNAMMEAARSQGLSLQVNSGFRSITEQQILFYNALDSWIRSGLSYEDARLETSRYIAYPGTSEHHLGLAVDISEESSWAWLKENSAEFGFILRYPIGKEEITGVAHEPWHFRYVGVEAAIEITSRGITLEEFLMDR